MTMKNFLLNFNKGINFSIYTNVHAATLLITYIIMVIIIINKEKISNIRNKNRIRVLFGIILLLFMVVRRGAYIYYQIYDIRYHLDLGFCNALVILFIIYCLTGNKKLYYFCYYGSFVGPFLSIMFPAINISINNFSFIIFLLFHNILFLMNLVFCVFENYKLEKSKYFFIMFVFMIYIFITNVVDLISGCSYNQLSNFIANRYLQNEIINSLVNNFWISMLIYITLGLICFKLANIFLENFGGKYEKKSNI